ncbi:MAG: tRNA (guanosine(46)-N7)-methyltransferase TrmB [Acidovorax sp. 17-64-282]|nr:MAG: tRNA (guanosine(46)-N7)-methyltransferase TrmB [Acidovorax sp. 17-64-282]
MGQRLGANLQWPTVTEPIISPAPEHAAAASPAAARASDGTPPPGVAYPKTIKSFVRRAGRTTTGQAKAFEDLGPRFVLPYAAAPLDAAVGALLKRIGEQGLTNIRILQHDAVEVIDNMLPSACLDGIHIFFPDPWHKKKHNKRRLIQAPLVAKLAERLKPGGYLHCATDWQPYADQILQVLGAEPMLANTAEGFAPQPDYRPLTKFENRGLRLGHGVWDVVFVRRN